MWENTHENVARRFRDAVGEEFVLEREPMSSHTTFRVGGPADFFLRPADAGELAAAVSVCREEGIPFFVMGNGSNLLVADKGFEGAVISTNRLSAMAAERTPEGGVIRAQAGAMLSKIAKVALDNGLTGFEFAAGIPGSLGGAVVMNAGAYGGEMRDVIRHVTVLTPDGGILKRTPEELAMGYRTSLVAVQELTVLEAEIFLETGDPEAIRARMEELSAMRREKQPLQYPSAGSTFKRPAGYFAGKLIDDAGLRGFSVGGAQVSEKHCGFVVNRGGATAADIMELCRLVSERVKKESGVALELEIRTVGRF